MGIRTNKQLGSTNSTQVHQSDILLTVDSHSSFLAPKDVPGGGGNRQMMGEMCRGTQKRQTNHKKDKLIQKKTN